MNIRNHLINIDINRQIRKNWQIMELRLVVIKK